MIYGAAYCKVRDHATLLSYGVADSKALTEEKREEIYAKIDKDKVVGYELRDITAKEISSQQLSRAGVSLNKISHNAAIELIKRVKEKVAADSQVTDTPETSDGNKRPREEHAGRLVGVFVDVVGPQEMYQSKLSHFFPECVVAVEKKADAKFPIVSAASIMAKVTRDRGIERYSPVEPLRATEIDLGSGYPADPITKKWLQRSLHKVFVLPEIARFDWQPVKQAEKSHCVAVDWEGAGDDLPELFGDDKAKRWQYFQEMFVRPATTF
eukprot:Sspe_Gene.33211::Locus_16236_Transcript_1_1_Confidence_1.000_Length_834::g.33211::m.33211/K10743/RNASEH2A; ribonuclease H2 subunit A